MMVNQSEAVKVVVRCRPMNEREKGMHSKIVVFMDSGLCQCSILNPNDASAPPKSFSFDGVYYTESATDSIYNEITYPLVEGVLEGYNATVFAYGQTGCGKSFTMQGISDSVPNKGIIPRAFEHVFESIETSDNLKYLVHASYLEIYNEEIRDLLGKDCKKKLDLKENPDRGVHVADLSQHPVHNVEECEALMEKGWRNRSVGATLMNADSSRSHSIFTINIEMMAADQHIRKGKLNLVDLAGSERQAKTGATGDRLKEATKINLSLSALGNVISALVDGKSKHIPYRDSKLTRLLQDSLGGNTKTLMVACVSPADNNYDETLSTLRYANRAKNIKNKPRINQDPKDALLSQYQEEIRQLREMLEKQQSMGIPDMLTESPLNFQSNSSVDLEVEKDKIRQEYEQQLQSLRQSYEAEKQGHARLQADVENLREQYQKEMNKIQEETTQPQQNGNHLAVPGMMSRRPSGVISPGTMQNGDNANLSPEQQEALARLQEIEENMVGGERAHDKELKEKLLKKKKAAERRSKLSEAINKSDDDDSLLIKAYDNIQEELRAKTDALKKSKQKIRSLEREISDLYSEFQNDRTDYLETIRRQDQQLKLLQGILDKIQPTIRKDCNYSNIDGIKAEAIWSDETQRWKLPELSVLKTKLPPAGIAIMATNNLRNATNNANRVPSRTAPASLSIDSDDPEDHKTESILIKKFETNDQDDFAENYFKPKRATELLIKAQQDANRVISKWKDLAQKVHSSNGNIYSSWNNNHVNGYNNKIQPNHHSWGPSPSFSPVQNGWGSAGSTMNGFLSSPEMGSMRRPAKLEALPIEATTKSLKKLKPLNSNEL
ncbi:unnamed protein product [Orchesella dallaii]|uniref:Kinesin-like protein n=1 Tax=Orchesella dallaii TaxID=48710 RepID=A0ABP1RR75_9HEXA